MPVLFLILACALWGLSFPLMRALQLEQSSRLAGVGSGFFAEFDLWDGVHGGLQLCANYIISTSRKVMIALEPGRVK